MIVEVDLPRLVGTRGSADEIVRTAVGSRRNVEALVLRARAVLNAAPSFVDEIVKLASERGIGEIRLVGESRELREQFVESANRRGGVRLVSSSEALV